MVGVVRLCREAEREAEGEMVSGGVGGREGERRGPLDPRLRVEDLRELGMVEEE